MILTFEPVRTRRKAVLLPWARRLADSRPKLYHRGIKLVLVVLVAPVLLVWIVLSTLGRSITMVADRLGDWLGVDL